MANTRYLAIFTAAEKDYDTLLAGYKATLPEEKQYIQAAYQSGGALSIGRFTDYTKGALGVFETKEAAEAFAKNDPFLREGICSSYTIEEFHELAVDEQATD